MIASTPDEVTQAGLAELACIDAPRLRQIMTATVQHRAAGRQKLRTAPISGKAEGERPVLAVLPRRA